MEKMMTVQEFMAGYELACNRQAPISFYEDFLDKKSEYLKIIKEMRLPISSWFQNMKSIPEYAVATNDLELLKKVKGPIEREILFRYALSNRAENCLEYLLSLGDINDEIRLCFQENKVYSRTAYALMVQHVPSNIREHHFKEGILANDASFLAAAFFDVGSRTILKSTPELCRYAAEMGKSDSFIVCFEALTEPIPPEMQADILVYMANYGYHHRIRYLHEEKGWQIAKEKIFKAVICSKRREGIYYMCQRAARYMPPKIALFCDVVRIGDLDSVVALHKEGYWPIPAGGIFASACHGCDSILRYLLEHIPDTTGVDFTKSIQTAIFNKHFECLRLLFEHLKENKRAEGVLTVENFETALNNRDTDCLIYLHQNNCPIHPNLSLFFNSITQHHH